MPPKKGGKKGAKKGKKGNKAEEQRLAQLQARENEAEEFQKHENDRRERECQDERISLLREEQLQLIREKERRIEELQQRETQVSRTLADDRMSFTSQIEALSVLRDSLLNEVSLLKSENEERHHLFTRERDNYVMQVQQLRGEMQEVRGKHEEEKGKLRDALHSTALELEEVRTEKETIEEEKTELDRTSELKARALGRELERMQALNIALQQAVEGREAEDKKNITLMQLLNSQLEENRRHYEEVLQDEQLQQRRLKEEILEWEQKCSHLREEMEVLRKEYSDAKHSSDTNLRDFERQMEQVKFDAEYLRGELQAMRQKTTETVLEAESARDEAQNNARNCKVELEAYEKRVEDLEALLYRKEREHFDKVTFLNAQISNNRTVIVQLQEKMAEERRSHNASGECWKLDMQQTLDELSQLHEAEKASAELRKENETRLLSDISVLKTTVFQLQSALDEKEKAGDKVVQAKDDEIHRLRDLLDAHFIPHRQSAESSTQSVEADVNFALRQKVLELQAEISAREQAALETETFLKARLTNQGEIIEQLQMDLKKSALQHLEEVRCLKTEISRLKKILEIHFIPVTG